MAFCNLNCHATALFAAVAWPICLGREGNDQKLLSKWPLAGLTMLSCMANSAARADERLTAPRYFRSRWGQMPPLATLASQIGSQSCYWYHMTLIA